MFNLKYTIMKTRLFLGVLLVAGMLAGCNRDDVQVESLDDVPDISPELVIMASDYVQESVPCEAMEIPFEVNVDWEASVGYGEDENGWLVITPESGRSGKASLMLTADANSTSTPRKAYVSIAYGGQTRRLTITQEGAVQSEDQPTPELEMHSATYYDNFYAHETYEEKIAFTVNTEWTVDVEYKGQSSDWLTVTPDSGTAGEVELSMMVAKNLSTDSRQASIRISYGGETTTLPIWQRGLNLVSIFEPQLTRLLQERGYVSSASVITPQDVKGIKSLQLHGNWDASREVYTGKLTSLNGIEYFESLESLTCWGNQLTSLDMSRNKALKELMCYSNQLTSIDVSGCPELQSLYCYENLLTSLDLQHNPALIQLCCCNNWLAMLDLRDNPVLKILDFTDNRLTAIDISRNTKVSQLRCFNNPGDGVLFPIFAWFDNKTIPVTEEIPDERPIRMLFPTEKWTYEGRIITPDYRKIN